MTHPLVLQLRYARSEFMRGLQGLSSEDACKRLEPMNCISWNIGHLAWQEQRYWLTAGLDQTPHPELNTLFCFGCPAITPALDEMLVIWRDITQAPETFLDGLTAEGMLATRVLKGRRGEFRTNTGNLMNRMIYHYWYHNGENQAIRQMLRNTGLADFVGNIDEEAPYTG